MSIEGLLSQDACLYRLEFFSGKYYSPTCFAAKKYLAHLASEDSARPFVIYDRVENSALIRMTSALVQRRLSDRGIKRNVILVPQLEVKEGGSDECQSHTVESGTRLVLEIPAGIWSLCVCY